MDNNINNKYEDKNIKYEIVKANPNTLKKKGYEKLSKDAFEKISMAMQSIPGQLTSKATEISANNAVKNLTKNAYKLVLKDGMHLAKSKSLDGAYKGLAFLDKDNSLVAHADWLPISLDGNIVTNSPQIILGVFNAMSIATGQYFLSQINHKLGDIEAGLYDIIGYLENEKRSEIAANDITLMNIYKNLGFIMQNGTERNSTIVELKILKNKSLGNLLFFNSKLESSRKKLEDNDKGKKEDLKEVIEDLYKDLPQYWCAVRSYSNAVVLESIVAEMSDPNYLANIRSEVENAINQYTLSCNSIHDQMNLFIELSNKMNKKRIISDKVGDIFDYIPAYNLPLALAKCIGKTIVEADKYIEKSSKKQKEEAIGTVNQFWDACKNYRSLKEPLELMNIFEKNNNSKVELICFDDKAYIKYC